MIRINLLLTVGLSAALLASVPLFSVQGPSLSIAQTSPAAENSGQTVHLEGQLKAGDVFERAIERELVFQLNPNHGPEISGWTIKIHPKIETQGTDAEFISVVTPPYRSSNARYLDNSYGISAKEAVAWTPRTFYFVLDKEGHKRASDALNKVLWPYNYSEGEVHAAGKALDDLPKGEGELRILDSKILEGRNEKDLGKIEWIKFAVDLKFPPAKETK